MELMSREPSCADLLRRLAMNDDRTVASLMSSTLTDGDVMHLGDKAAALLRVAALVAADSPVPAYQWAVSVARAAGATDDEIVGVLCAVGPIVGSARITAAAATLTLALGYEADPLDVN
jgi:alkylhydroperoxidase family enzyme